MEHWQVKQTAERTYLKKKNINIRVQECMFMQTFTAQMLGCFFVNIISKQYYLSLFKYVKRTNKHMFCVSRSFWRPLYSQERFLDIFNS